MPCVATKNTPRHSCEDLRWLGLGWEEGPAVRRDAGALCPVASAAHVYRNYFDALESRAAAPIRASAASMSSKSRARPRSPPAARRAIPAGAARLRRRRWPSDAPGACRPRCAFACRKAGAWCSRTRCAGDRSFETGDIGDFVIRRSDGTPAFFFCNAIDDALMGVTLVLRGEDHLTNTPRQILLLQALALPRAASTRTSRWWSAPTARRCPSAPVSKSVRGVARQRFLAACHQ